METTEQEKLTKIQTFTGLLMDPLNAQPHELLIEDIAHALSNMPRFAGHLKEFYSVGEHCLRCLSFAMDTPYDLEVLMHDATEAYLMDIPSPIKYRFPDYVAAEKQLANTIDITFGLYSQMFADRIKEIDKFVLQEELSFLLNDTGGDRPIWYQIKQTPKQIEHLFLNEYYRLTRKRVENVHY